MASSEFTFSVLAPAVDVLVGVIITINPSTSSLIPLIVTSLVVVAASVVDLPAKTVDVFESGAPFTVCDASVLISWSTYALDATVL